MFYNKMMKKEQLIEKVELSLFSEFFAFKIKIDYTVSLVFRLK